MSVHKSISKCGKLIYVVTFFQKECEFFTYRSVRIMVILIELSSYENSLGIPKLQDKASINEVGNSSFLLMVSEVKCLLASTNTEVFSGEILNKTDFMVSKSKSIWPTNWDSKIVISSGVLKTIHYKDNWLNVPVI